MNCKLIYAAILVAVALEIVSPIPFVLSLGTVYVLLAKPKWFRDFVRWLYGEAEEGEREQGRESGEGKGAGKGEGAGEGKGAGEGEGGRTG
jgi:hypothetical protein